MKDVLQHELYFLPFFSAGREHPKRRVGGRGGNPAFVLREEGELEETRGGKIRISALTQGGGGGGKRGRCYVLWREMEEREGEEKKERECPFSS